METGWLVGIVDGIGRRHPYTSVDSNKYDALVERKKQRHYILRSQKMSHIFVQILTGSQKID